MEKDELYSYVHIAYNLDRRRKVMEISNKRCIQILKLLLKNKECMTGDNLAVAIGVSSRTIRNDMKDLNRALEDHGASVVSEIGQGYYLKIEIRKNF